MSRDVTCKFMHYYCTGLKHRKAEKGNFHDSALWNLSPVHNIAAALESMTPSLGTLVSTLWKLSLFLELGLSTAMVELDLCTMEGDLHTAEMSSTSGLQNLTSTLWSLTTTLQSSASGLWR